MGQVAEDETDDLLSVSGAGGSLGFRPRISGAGYPAIFSRAAGAPSS